MKTGKTLVQLATELDRQAKAKRDFKTPTADLAMEHKSNAGHSEVKLRVNGFGAFGITKNGHEQIGSYTSIPRPYYERMKTAAPDLLADNVNHWLSAEKEQRLVRTLDGNVRAFLSPKYRPIDNYDVAHVALEEMGKLRADMRSTEVTERRMYLKAVVMNFTAKVKAVGDIVAAGLMVTNSEVGRGAFKVEPIVEVLRCSNGLVVNEAAMRQYHVGRHQGGVTEAEEFFSAETLAADNKVLMMKMRDTIRGSFRRDVFEKVVERMNVAAGRLILGNVEKAVETAQEIFGLTDGERSDVLQTLIRTGHLSQYGLLDAVTEASQRVEDYDRATELERVGGTILEMNDRTWALIANAKAA